MSARPLPLAALLLLFAPAGAAWACDPVPLPERSATLILPEPDATGVPTDAVLVARGIRGVPGVTLQVEESGQAVELAQACEAGSSICSAHPLQRLAANTAYRWRTTVSDGGGGELPSGEGRFTTGEGPSAPSRPALEVTHAGFEKGESSCGPYDNARFTLRLEDPGAAAWLLVWTSSEALRPLGVGPERALSVAAPAPLVLPAQATLELDLPRDTVCLDVVSLDPAGRRQELGRRCPRAPADDFLGGCAAAGGGPLTLGLLSLAGLLRRRRRIPR